MTVLPRFLGDVLLLVALLVAAGCEASRNDNVAEQPQSLEREILSGDDSGVDPEPLIGTGTRASSELNGSKQAVQSVDAEGLQEFIADRQGQVVLVDFWATWCGVCREGFPEVVKLGQKYAGTDLVITSVALDDAEALPEIERFLTEQLAPRPAFISSYGVADAESMDAFQLLSGTIPTLKLFDRRGMLRFTFGDGQPFTHEEIDLAVRQLLSE